MAALRRTRARPRIGVWTVVVAVVAQNLLQAIDAQLDQRHDKVLSWAIGALLMGALAFLAENYKPTRRR